MTTGGYHHGNLRAALVEAAAQLARMSGPEGVVLREVARRTGVSHNAAYRHFTDRKDLLAAVGQRAMEELEAAMSARLATVRARDPERRARRRLRETGRAYVAFALAEPGLFEVAFATKDPPGAGDGQAGPYVLLNTVLDELVASGGLAPQRRPGADVACWAAVHGLAALLLHGPLQGLPDTERDAVLDSTLDVVDRGLH